MNKLFAVVLLPLMTACGPANSYESYDEETDSIKEPVLIDCSIPSGTHKLTNINIVAVSGNVPWAWYSNYDIMQWSILTLDIAKPRLPTGEFCTFVEPSHTVLGTNCLVRQSFWCPNGITYNSTSQATKANWSTATTEVWAHEADGVRRITATFNVLKKGS